MVYVDFDEKLLFKGLINRPTDLFAREILLEQSDKKLRFTTLHCKPKSSNSHSKNRLTGRITGILMRTPNDHAIVHNSPHSRAMASKPFLISPLRRYAPMNALEDSVPLSFQRPQPSSITNSRIHDFDNSRPRRICGEAISPPICIKPLPLAFEYLGEAYPTF
jgi:hypothetical protein